MTAIAPASTPRRARRFRPDRDVHEWHGPYRPYDLVKEFVIALVVVSILVVLLAIVFSSPDETPVTLRSWSNRAPVDFVSTAISELDGTSGTAGYGPPYVPGSGQKLGPISLQQFVGVHIPVNTAQTFVIDPLKTLPDRPGLRAAVSLYEHAPATRQAAWTSDYESSVKQAAYTNGQFRLPPGRYGPVAPMMTSLLSMAQSGALDGALLSSKQFYDTDYTKPLLFIADGQYMANLAHHQHLTGDQWGMMNETGNYPGQAWLWLYTLWYQVPPMNSSHNGDIEVWAIMMGLTVVLLLVPFIPGLRSIPRLVPVYRLIWRRHYVELAAARENAPPSVGTAESPSR